MNLNKFLNSKNGKYIMSIILGIGLSALFRKVCKRKECQIKMPPPFEELDDYTYKFNGDCYKYTKHAVKCNNNKQIIEVN